MCSRSSRDSCCLPLSDSTSTTNAKAGASSASPGALPNDELCGHQYGLIVDRSVIDVFDSGNEHFDAPAADGREILADGGQRRRVELGFRDIVETRHQYVVGSRAAGFG